MKIKLKDVVPYLIVAQTVMLFTITVVTVMGALLTDVFLCKLVGSQRILCAKK